MKKLKQQILEVTASGMSDIVEIKVPPRNLASSAGEAISNFNKHIHNILRDDSSFNSSFVTTV